MLTAASYRYILAVPSALQVATPNWNELTPKKQEKLGACLWGDEYFGFLEEFPGKWGDGEAYRQPSTPIGWIAATHVHCPQAEPLKPEHLKKLRDSNQKIIKPRMVLIMIPPEILWGPRS